MSFLDSLRAAFKGGAGKRVPLARSFISPWAPYALGAFESAGTRPPFEYRTAVARAFLDNPVAQRAVRIVAEGVGSAPLLPSDAAAQRLVAATSAGQSLLETLAAQLLLHGNGYVQVIRDASGAPAELYALRPERVTVVAGADGWPAAYKYKVGDTTLSIPVEDEDGWPQVVHLKAFHPADDHRGPGAEGILRQRGPCADRRAAPSRDRRRSRRSAGRPGRGRVLAGRRGPDRCLGRSSGRAGFIPGWRLAVRRTARRGAPARPLDRAGRALPRRVAAPGDARHPGRRDDGRCRSPRGHRRADRRAYRRRAARRELISRPAPLRRWPRRARDATPRPRHRA